MLIPPETCCCVRGQHVHQTVVRVEDTQPSYQERLLDYVTPPECDTKLKKNKTNYFRPCLSYEV